MRRASPLPSAWPVLSRLPNSVHALPVGSPVSLAGEELDAVVGQQLAEPIRRQVFAVLGHAGPELFPGDRAFDLRGHRRNGGLGGRRHGRQGHELMARLDRTDPARQHGQELLAHVVPQAVGEEDASAGRHVVEPRRSPGPAAGCRFTRFWNSSAASRSQGL